MPFVDHASSLYSELVEGPAAHVPRSAPRRYIDALQPLTAQNRRQTGHVINLKKVTRAIDIDSMNRLIKNTIFGFVVKF